MHRTTDRDAPSQPLGTSQVRSPAYLPPQGAGLTHATYFVVEPAGDRHALTYAHTLTLHIPADRIAKRTRAVVEEIAQLLRERGFPLGGTLRVECDGRDVAVHVGALEAGEKPGSPGGPRGGHLERAD